LQAQAAQAAQAEQAKAIKIAEQEKIDNVKSKQKARVSVKSESAKRKSAATTKKSVKSKPNIDYFNDSDEAFEQWYANLEANS